MPPMTDIVERLRQVVSPGNLPSGWHEATAVCAEAADEIERLTGLLEWHDTTVPEILADNERLRAALEIIAGRRQCLDNLMGNVDVACAALDGAKP
jgi:hypothetical protein